MKKRGGRKRATGARASILIEASPNAIARGRLTSSTTGSACDRRFRILNVIDNVTGERLTAIPGHFELLRRVARELEVIIARRGMTDRASCLCPEQP